MNEATIEKSFSSLKEFCERNNFKGWDPYDGLNSRVFQHLPLLRGNRIARLAWIQFFKRSPVNFRPVMRVEKQYNTKGLGLFLTGYCNLYRLEQENEHLEKIKFLAEKIISLSSKGYSGSCWGYNFDWQARAFFQPKGTPTVVATSFVADALFNAYEITQNQGWLEVALSAVHFTLNDLNRTYDVQGNLCFSYSPLDKTSVLNASLLGGRLLARAYHYTKEEHLKQTAGKVMAFAVTRQQADGSWTYGTLPFHEWIDNFHTGFNLECISDYMHYTGDSSFTKQFETGFNYYIKEFFTDDGKSKYYHNQLYPVDIHSPAQLIVTLIKTSRFREHQALAEKVLEWTINHMQSARGYFYYQHKKIFSSRIPYMRWAQAWMFYSMSYYLKETRSHGNTTD